MQQRVNNVLYQTQDIQKENSINDDFSIISIRELKRGVN